MLNHSLLQQAVAVMLAAGIALFVPAGARAADTARVVEKTLDNGLKVIVREDNRAPTAVQMLWYSAGSMDEVNGRTGIAHLLEHMMFKGTAQYPDGEFSRRVANLGGRENAFTSREYTAYFQQVQSSALPEMMMLEADRMHNLALQPELFLRERDVVKEERRLRVDDSAGGRVFEALMALAYSASPVRTPIIGWMDDLHKLTLADAQDWYATWYVPGNATLVVVGDVVAEEVFEHAQRTYGEVPARALPERRNTAEPPQQGMRRASVKAPAKAPQVVLAFHVPALRDVDNDIDPYALEMLAAVLDSGDTGRLTRELVREQRLANSVSASYSMIARGPVLFTLGATPADGQDVGELEAALRAQVARIAKEGVTAEELDRIRTQYVASQVFGLDSLFGQVMRIGVYEMAGLSHRDADRVLERVQRIEPAQVQDVAARFFTDETLTVVTLDPQPVNGEPLAAAAPAAGSMPVSGVVR